MGIGLFTKSDNQNSHGGIPHTKTGIRFRAILIGILLIIGSAFWIHEGEMARYTFATWAAPFYNAIFMLFVLTILNLAAWKWTPSLALSKIELLANYVMVSVGSAIVSTDLMGILISVMGHSTQFATPENNWSQLFKGILPNWLIVTDKEALKGYYEGNSTLYTAQHIKAWLMPAVWWCLFAWALFFCSLCITVLLRKQWVDKERLTFPIVQLPLQMVQEPKEFFSSKLMWLGFAIAGGITLINGINYLVPTSVYIPIKRVDYPVFSVPPWNAVGNVRVAFYFFAIALGFLMPLDLSFSLWFFYLLYKFEAVFVACMGTEAEMQFPYYADQAFGAYICIFVMALWGLRGELKMIWQKTSSGRGEDDSGEAASYRLALAGLLVTGAFLVGFMIAAGMSAHVAIAFFLIYFAIAVMITRIRSELGMPVHDMSGLGPSQTLVRVFGTEAFSPKTLGVFAVTHWLNRIYRSQPMPHMLEGFKLADSQEGMRRAMFRAIVVALIVAAPICFWVYLQRFYVIGAATAKSGPWALGFGREAFDTLGNWLGGSTTSQLGNTLAMIFGFLFAMLLATLRRAVLGFPFHPLAYAVANSWGMQNLWLPIMIGSICKGSILKASGLQGYRKAMLFFFGLMLGELVVGSLWTLGGMAVGVRTYDFWP